MFFFILWFCLSLYLSLQKVCAMLNISICILPLPMKSMKIGIRRIVMNPQQWQINYCGFIFIRWIPIFVGFVVTIKCSTHYKYHIGFVLYTEIAKQRNQISTKMQVFLNPRKLIPRKIIESTVYFETENQYPIHNKRLQSMTVTIQNLIKVLKY